MAESKEPAPEDPRVRFAGERTLLAWIRTGLAMMGFGFVVARFGLFLRELSAAGRAGGPTSSLSLWLGSGLVILGVTVNVMAAVQHTQFLRRLSRGEPFVPSRWSLGIITAVLLAVIGLGMTAYLFSLEQ